MINRLILLIYLAFKLFAALASRCFNFDQLLAKATQQETTITPTRAGLFPTVVRPCMRGLCSSHIGQPRNDRQNLTILHYTTFRRENGEWWSCAAKICFGSWLVINMWSLGQSWVGLGPIISYSSYIYDLSKLMFQI